MNYCNFCCVVHGVLTTSGSCQLSDERIWLIWELLPSAITSDWYVVTDHCFAVSNGTICEGFNAPIPEGIPTKSIIIWQQSVALRG